MAEPLVADLVRLAGSGDQIAWDRLVERFAGLVWHVARGYRLEDADAADVSQTVWLRLVEHLADVREPAALAGWLVTTTRHEALRSLRRHGREVPDDDAAGGGLADRPDDGLGPEQRVLRDERGSLVVRALGTLSPRCQLLLRAIASAPEASYAEVSEALGMPVGSIGPTRSRCFQHLRRALAQLGVVAAGD